MLWYSALNSLQEGQDNCVQIKKPTKYSLQLKKVALLIENVTSMLCLLQGNK